MWKFTETHKTVPPSGYNAIDVFNSYPIMLNEGIQNSMDAVADKTKPVHIDISLEQIDKKSLHNFLFSSQEEKEHFKISKKYPDSKDSKTTIFKFEDYNTNGITGDIYDQKDGGSPMNAFLLSEGVTSKEKREGKTGGSRGIGKSSFIYTSEYHTFFFSTLSNEGETHLGRAYLEPKREVKGSFFVKDAYFVQDSNRDEINSMEEGEKLDTFKTVFNTNRIKNGTSIFILSPKYQDLKTNELFVNNTLKSIIKNYYFLFIEDKLTVAISDSMGKEHNINNSTIYDYMLTKGEFSSEYIDFIKSTYLDSIPEIRFNERRESFKSFHNIISEEEKTEFLNLYHSGDVFKATFLYFINKNEEEVTFFIKKSDEKVTETHLRRHILQINKSAQTICNNTKNKMFIGVNILAEDPTELTEDLLKKCEDENHQEWKNQDDNKKDPIRLMITHHIPEFLHLITQSKQEQKKEAFYVFDDVFPTRPKDETDKGTSGGKVNISPPPIDGKEHEFKISKISKKHGFKVSTNTDKKYLSVIIRVGYKQERKGTEQSIKNYRTHEFNVADMKSKVTGADIILQKNNEIHLSNVSNDFTFSIEGFENEFNFDLAVDVKGVENEKDS